jgi:hypothetical protein
MSLAVAGLGDVLCCHATPRDDEKILSAIRPASRVAPMFAGVTQRIVICGHTHIQFERTIGQTGVMNAGSVGMPFQRPAGAYWMMLGPDVEFWRTRYDLQRAADRLRACAYPDSEDFVLNYVLNPPDAETMQHIFEQALSPGSAPSNESGLLSVVFFSSIAEPRAGRCVWRAWRE